MILRHNAACNECLRVTSDHKIFPPCACAKEEFAEIFDVRERSEKDTAQPAKWKPRVWNETTTYPRARHATDPLRAHGPVGRRGDPLLVLQARIGSVGRVPQRVRYRSHALGWVDRVGEGR